MYSHFSRFSRSSGNPEYYYSWTDKISLIVPFIAAFPKFWDKKAKATTKVPLHEPPKRSFSNSIASDIQNNIQTTDEKFTRVDLFLTDTKNSHLQPYSQSRRLLSYLPFPAEWKNVNGEPPYRTTSRPRSVRRAVRRLCE